MVKALLTAPVRHEHSLSPPAFAPARRPAAPAQPRGDGLHAHRPGRPPAGLRQAGGLLPGAGAGRRRADHHRRLRAQPGGLAAALRQQPDPRPGSAGPPPPDPGGAHRGRAHPAADPACRALRLSPAGGVGLATEVPHQLVRPARAERAGHRAHPAGLRALRAAGQGGGLRRGGDHGQRGLPAEPVPLPAHQPAPRPLGRLAGEPYAPGGGDRPAHPPHGRGRLRHRLPPVAAGPGGGRQHRRGGAADRPGAAGGRHRPAQHRHRLARVASAHHCHLGAARGLCRGQRTAAARVAGAGGGQQPHQHPGAGRGADRQRPGGPGVHGPAAAGRPAVRRQGGGGPARGDQHLHRLQPGLPGPRLRQPPRQLPGQSTGRLRDRAALPPHPPAQAHRRGRRRAGGAFRRLRGRRARAPGDAVRGGGRDRRAVQPGPAHPRQGGVRRDAALLPHPSGRAGGGAGAQPPHRPRRAERPLRRGGGGHRGAPPRAGAAGRRTPQGAQLRRGAVGRAGGRTGGAGGGRWHRLRSGGLPAAAAHAGPGTLARRVGHRPARHHARRAGSAARPAAAAGAVAAATQAGTPRPGAGQDQRLGPPRPPATPGRADAGRGGIPARGQRRPAHPPRRARAGAACG